MWRLIWWGKRHSFQHILMSPQTREFYDVNTKAKLSTIKINIPTFGQVLNWPMNILKTPLNLCNGLIASYNLCCLLSCWHSSLNLHSLLNAQIAAEYCILFLTFWILRYIVNEFWFVSQCGPQVTCDIRPLVTRPAK